MKYRIGYYINKHEVYTTQHGQVFQIFVEKRLPYSGHTKSVYQNTSS